MNTSVEVHIGGLRFVVRSEETAERVGQLAAYVDRKLREVRENTNTINSYNVALLAALNIADEYFSEKARRLDRSEELAERTRDILNRLDAYLDSERENKQIM